MRLSPSPRLALLVCLALAGSLANAGCAGPATSRSVDAASPPLSTAAPSVDASPTVAPPTASPPAEAPPEESPPPAFTPLGALPTGVFDATTVAALQEILDAVVARGAPDAIAAVITEDGAWAGAAGIAGPDARLATPEDEFAIASITKTFTAALIMRLAEQGRIDLEAPIADYLDGLPVDTNGATVRQALQMRGGLGNHVADAASRIGADAAHVWTREEMIALYLPPVSEPGAFHVSNPSYELLGYAAEHVTGLSYGGALRAEVLDPVGADRILGQADGVVTPQPWALPTGDHLGQWTEADMGTGGAISCISSASFSIGAGSVASDAPSLAAWVWHLFAGDILAPETVRGMLPSPGSQFAYGLEKAPYSEPGSIHNAGGKTGYGSQFVYFPTSRAVIVIFVNDPQFITEPTVMRLLAAAVPT